MDEDVIADLRQFITATITQQSAGLRGDIVDSVREDIVALHEDITKIDSKLDDLSISVTEAMDNFDQATETQLNNHEQRITRLEAKTA